MSEFITIRKNAKKKIKGLLESAQSIVLRGQTMRIDDSAESYYRQCTVDEVMAWLEDEDNYQDARVSLQKGLVLRVGGPYGFCHQFYAILDTEAGEHLGKSIMKASGLLEAEPAAQEPNSDSTNKADPPADLPAGVTYIHSVPSRIH